MRDPRYVLGVGGFIHDYNCALVDTRTGRVAMREAERYSRRKHHVPSVDEELLALPLRCCADLECRPSDIDTVVLAACRT
jgi:predicted NodU family carbamoyl transferase